MLPISTRCSNNDSSWVTAILSRQGTLNTDRVSTLRATVVYESDTFEQLLTLVNKSEGFWLLSLMLHDSFCNICSTMKAFLFPTIFKSEV